jgi:8-oxo-dGTP pyrophosphatase MutT (NUDIX family)
MNEHIYHFIYKLAKFYWRITKPITRGARTVILAENKFLLIKHIFSGSWVFPGGHIELGEEPSVAAMREVREEVGISLDDVTLVGSFTHNTEGKIDTVFSFYKILDRIPEVKLDTKESTEYSWFEINSNLPLGPINTRIWTMTKDKLI